MQIHTLHPNHPRHEEKRVGRGGKRGTYSGRGQKGQRARAGHNIRPGLRDVLIRTPKLRGYANKRVSEKYVAISIGRIANLKEERIDRSCLIAHHIIRSAESPKIVLDSKKDLAVAKTIVAIPCTAGARRSIEKAGGKVVTTP